MTRFINCKSFSDEIVAGNILRLAINTDACHHIEQKGPKEGKEDTRAHGVTHPTKVGRNYMHKKDRCPSVLNKSGGIDLKVTSGGAPLELLQPELELSPFPGVSFSRLVRVLTSNP